MRKRNPSAPQPLGPPQRSPLVLLTEERHPRRSPALRFPGWSEHAQTGASRASRAGRASPPRGSSRGAGPRAVLGDGPSHRKAALSPETCGRGPAGLRAALQLSHLTPFSLAHLPPAHSHPGPAFFPRHDLKAAEGQPRGAGLLAPCPPWPAPSPLSSSRPLPRAGPPPALAPGPPAIIPAPLQRTSCIWLHPHQLSQHVLSLLSP